MPQHVSFVTSDKVTIVGNYYPGSVEGPTVLLLHMMPATKESWDAFARNFIAKGFGSVLAIDLRGHGESTQGDGVKLDYRDFSDTEHKAKINDVEAAVDWLRGEQGVGADRLAIVGGSIGANLSIVYGSANRQIKVLAALSPGLNYYGLTTEDAIRKISADQKLFLAASADDAYSFETIRTLAGIKKDATVKEYKTAGHATGMFDNEPDLMDELADWLKDALQ